MTNGSQRDDPPRRRKGPLLGPDDETLWHRISRSVTPVRKMKGRVPEVELEPPTPSGDRSKASTGRPPPPKLERSTSQAKLPERAAPARAAAKPRSPLPQPTLERRQARRIAAGTVEIEARLDLHGLTQRAAHDRLVGFLQHAAASGLKTVLVITGKGGRRRFFDLGWGQADGDVGILRASVPRWLAEAPLRGMVVGYQTAAIQHGGDGAFYIQLRRKRAK